MEIYTIDSSQSPVLPLQILALSSLKNLVSQSTSLSLSLSVSLSLFLSLSFSLSLCIETRWRPRG